MGQAPHPEGRLVKAMLEMIKQARLHRSCVTCSHFDMQTEQCGLFQLRPPAGIIAAGCGDEHYSEVPPF